MRTLTVAIIIGAVAAGAMAIPPATDFIVNTTTYGLQYDGDIAAQEGPGGTFVAVWRSQNRDAPPSVGEVRGRLFTHGATGWNPVGADFAVQTTGVVQLPPDNQPRESVDMDTAGNFVISATSTNYDLLVSRRNAGGGSAGADLIVAAGAGLQPWSDIALRNDGVNYVVAYNSALVGTVDYQVRAFADNSLVASGSVTSGVGAQDARVVYKPDGSWLMVYHEQGAGVGGQRVQMFSAANAPVGAPINTFPALPSGTVATSANQNVGPISVDAAGNFVVVALDDATWDSDGAGPLPADNDNIWAQRFDSAGNAVGAVIRVCAQRDLTSQNMWPAVAMADDGSFTVSYTITRTGWLPNPASNRHTTFARRFSKYGGAVDPIDVHLATSQSSDASQAYGSMDALPDGTSLTCWGVQGNAAIAGDGGGGSNGFFAVRAAGQMAFLYGDINLDLAVDAGDYGTWQANYGTAGPHAWGTGDLNNDAVVDAGDYGIWQANYGTTLTAPVPEPATMALLAIGGLAVLRRRRR